MNNSATLETLAEVEVGDSSRNASRVLSRAKGVPYYVKALAMGLPAFCFGLTIRGWIDFLSHIPAGRADFRHLYATAFMVRTGHSHEIYNYVAQKFWQDHLTRPANLALPFNHLAYESLIFIPFSYLSYSKAYLFWLGINALLVTICFLRLRRELEPLKAAWRWLPVAVFIGFIPLSAAMEQGQDSILLLTLLVLAYISLRRNNDLSAGLLIGAGLFKFQLVLPIALLFLLWRKWRVTFGFAASGLATLLISLIVAGIAGFRSYARMLTAMSFGLSAELQTVYGIPPRWMPNLRGFIFALSDGRLAPIYQTVLILLASVVIVLFSVRFAGNRSSDQLLLAIVVAALVSYHLLLHDMSILLLPIVVVMARNIEIVGHADKHKWLFRASALAFAAIAWRIFPPTMFFLTALPLMLFWIAILSFGTRSAEASR